MVQFHSDITDTFTGTHPDAPHTSTSGRGGLWHDAAVKQPLMHLTVDNRPPYDPFQLFVPINATVHDLKVAVPWAASQQSEEGFKLGDTSLDIDDRTLMSYGVTDGSQLLWIGATSNDDYNNVDHMKLIFDNADLAYLHDVAASVLVRVTRLRPVRTMHVLFPEPMTLQLGLAQLSGFHALMRSSRGLGLPPPVKTMILNHLTEANATCSSLDEPQQALYASAELFTHLACFPGPVKCNWHGVQFSVPPPDSGWRSNSTYRVDVYCTSTRLGNLNRSYCFSTGCASDTQGDRYSEIMHGGGSPGEIKNLKYVAQQMFEPYACQ